MNIYVGNFSRDVTEEEVRAVFENYGKVDSVKVIKDSFSGESRGFGFVEMPDETQAQAAINELNGKELKGRNMVVNKARPRTEGRSGRGGGGGGGGRRFGGGGGFRRDSY